MPPVDSAVAEVSPAAAEGPARSGKGEASMATDPAGSPLGSARNDPAGSSLESARNDPAGSSRGGELVDPAESGSTWPPTDRELSMTAHGHERVVRDSPLEKPEQVHQELLEALARPDRRPRRHHVEVLGRLAARIDQEIGSEQPVIERVSEGRRRGEDPDLVVRHM